jgi:hypothetical protein
MSVQVITATEASRSLSDVLNKVHYQHQSFDIRRGKEIIAKIIPASPFKQFLKISELNELFKRLPSLEKGDSEAFEKSIRELRANMQVKGNQWD